MAILNPRSKKRNIWALSVLALLLVPVLAVWSPALRSTRNALATSDTFVLYSLAPYYEDSASNHPRYFYNSRIMGQTQIIDPRLKSQLVDSLCDSLRPNQTFGAACLAPRYAIHATKGWRTIDVIICFDCANVVFRQYGKSSRIIPMESTSARAIYDRVLQQAGVPQSKRQ